MYSINGINFSSMKRKIDSKRPMILNGKTILNGETNLNGINNIKCIE